MFLKSLVSLSSKPFEFLVDRRKIISGARVLIGNSTMILIEIDVNLLTYTYLLPGMPLACRAATKVLHFCLSLAIFCSQGVIH